MNTGTVVSRTLAEAGLTPEEGMQVYFKRKGICYFDHLVGDRGVVLISGNQTYTLTLLSELKTLLVEYINPKFNIMPTYNDELPKLYLPLNLSQWQQAIDGGYVDSGKEVQWGEQYGDGRTFVSKPTHPEAFKYYVATLIPQQSFYEDEFEKEMLEADPKLIYLSSKEFNAAKRGYKAAKKTALIPQQDDVEKLAEDATKKHYNMLNTRFEDREFRAFYKGFLKGYQAVWSHQQKLYSEEEVRKITTKFFYHWYNAKGTNTEQGFDDWWTTTNLRKQ